MSLIEHLWIKWRVQPYMCNYHFTHWYDWPEMSQLSFVFVSACCKTLETTKEQTRSAGLNKLVSLLFTYERWADVLVAADGCCVVAQCTNVISESAYGIFFRTSQNHCSQSRWTAASHLDMRFAAATLAPGACVSLSPPLLCPPLCPHWSLLRHLQDDNIVTFGEFQVGCIQSCWGSKFHNLLCCNCLLQIYGVLGETWVAGGGTRGDRRMRCRFFFFCNFVFQRRRRYKQSVHNLRSPLLFSHLISKPPLLLYLFYLSCFSFPLLPLPSLSSPPLLPTPLLTFPLYSVCMAATSTPQSSPPSIVDAIGCCR